MDSIQAQVIPKQRSFRSRKILLDADVYCSHSMRESAGDAGCDHDFEMAPDVIKDAFAVWHCTRCGRAFRFEFWHLGTAAD